MQCRLGCGACCIAPSINHPLPNMPKGKPAGVRCVNLSDLNLCRLWGSADYPKTCERFQPEQAVCGETDEEALQILTLMESETSPR